MLSSQPDPIVIETKLHKLAMSPRVFGIANHAIQDMIRTPGSPQLADTALDVMTDDPMLHRAYEDLATE